MVLVVLAVALSVVFVVLGLVLGLVGKLHSDYDWRKYYAEGWATLELADGEGEDPAVALWRFKFYARV